MPKYNQDYLKFDAFSIKEALIRRLSDNDTFTDQLFEGSNLVTIIDCFSHLYELLMYYTNHGASESMFSDTQLYENINRIVKLIGYSPMGGLSCTSQISYYNENSGSIYDGDIVQKELPKYSSVDTGLVDSQGNSIYYSLIERMLIYKENIQSDANVFNIVNGRWKAYPRTFNSEGTPFEEYVLSELKLDSELESFNYIAHPYIDIFVKTTDDDTGEEIFDQYSAVYEGNIFGSSTSLLTPSSKKFELRINENKLYTIKFGDGIHGKKLKKGDEIYVVYLEGNGPEGTIGANVIDGTGVFTWGIGGLENNIFLKMINVESVDDLISSTEMNKIHFTNIVSSTAYQDLENVESIRANAPVWAKSNNRLVTKEDYEQFMQIYHGADLYDVKVMNQWDYSSSFYYWLSKYNKLTTSIRGSGYLYTDACDFNNVYIWCKLKGIDLNESLIQYEMYNRKSLTVEPKVLKCLDSLFVPCLVDNNYSINNWDENYENWLEVVKDKNSFISPERIRNQVMNTLKQFFDASLNEIGQVLDFNSLYSKLLDIDGVQYIRSAYLPSGTPDSDTVYYNGISFASWTPLLIEGLDKSIIKGIYKLEPFQFPVLLLTNLVNRIKIVAESFNQSAIEF